MVRDESAIEDVTLDLSKVAVIEAPMAMCLVYRLDKLLFISKHIESLKPEEQYFVRGIEAKDKKRIVMVLPEGIAGMMKDETVPEGMVRILKEQAKTTIQKEKLKLHGKIVYMNEDESQKQIVYVYSTPFRNFDFEFLGNLNWIHMDKQSSLANTRPDIRKVVSHVFSLNTCNDTFELNILYHKNGNVRFNLINISERQRKEAKHKKEKLLC
ncbi:MAG: hypothetical protein ABR981_00575 [Candidatus Micrarchaeaceae archaeon]